MPFLSQRERTLLGAVSRLAYCNPFLPERTEIERDVLGSDFVPGEPVWSLPVEDPERPRENVWRIFARMEPLAEQLRRRLATTGEARKQDLELYEDAILQMLYQRYYRRFYEASFGAAANQAGRWRFYQEFRADWRHFLELDNIRLPTQHDPVHTFACFRQIQRAFEQIFRDIIGGSMSAARLRAAVWQSVFSHDMRRYRRTLYGRMGDFATLITGPSGTGKEIAARSIAQSRYLAFDERKLAFPEEESAVFFAINISALSPTLVESELFGHRRGSFTGAIADRKGWLETCPPAGAVFLDELGDLDPAIQVKLLRVIETRTFHPVGETAGRQFRGKLIAATNRDLAAAIRDGRFREDLYYRLCSDQIVTPSLAEQLADTPGVLRELIVYMTRRVAGAEADELAEEVSTWIEQNLGADYAWPGNYRELEQCVRNVLIRRDYRPSQSARKDPFDLRSANLTADQLVSRYCTLVYSQTGSYEETARRLKLDRRTVKSKIDANLLIELRQSK
jgi:transcriptional regulator with AAA-type ATPase domain